MLICATCSWTESICYYMLMNSLPYLTTKTLMLCYLTRGWNNYKTIEQTLTYSLKPRTSQNKPKLAETAINQPKRQKKSCKTTPNNQKFQSWGNLKFSACFHFSNFGAKRINFLILTKFCMYPILNVLISNLLFGFEKLEPKGSNLDILDQKVLTF